MPRFAAAELVGIPAFVPALSVIILGITYLCVPETDHFSTLGLLAFGLTAIELLTAQAQHPSQLALLVLVLWAGLHGSAGRGSALVGFAMAFWPLVCVVVVSAAARGRATRTLLGGVVVTGTIAAVFVARTGALAADTGPALRSAAVAVPASTAALAVIVRRWLRSQDARAERTPTDSLGMS